MEILAFIANNIPLIVRLTGQHVSIVGVAVGAAILTGVPIGIAIAQHRQLASIVIGLASVVTTIPSIALFGFLLPILATINQGIGYLPAVIAVFLYSQLPIIQNTHAAITTIDPALREAARGMGMTRLQRLLRVEVPLALPVIMAGVRVAVVLNIGVATIAAYIGAGGLGLMIRGGISQTDPRQLIAGALAVSLLAIVADSLLGWVERRLAPPGLVQCGAR